MGLRSFLYKVARLMGDANAVKKGKVGKRVARQATVWRLAISCEEVTANVVSIQRIQT
jgi:hypothetical protein